MTKLEEKLLELGYVYDHKNSYKYEIFMWKPYGEFGSIKINIERGKNQINFAGVDKVGMIQEQQDIDNLQQAFNILQQDLEVLKEYENS